MLECLKLITDPAPISAAAPKLKSKLAVDPSKIKSEAISLIEPFKPKAELLIARKDLRNVIDEPAAMFNAKALELNSTLESTKSNLEALICNAPAEILLENSTCEFLKMAVD